MCTQMVGEMRTIFRESIDAVLPEAAVRDALCAHPVSGAVTLVAIGKAAWRMAAAAYEMLGERVARGLVVTKYGHSMGPIGPLEIIEAGHPVPDENSVRGGQRALELADAAGTQDVVLLLVSGGGSALFESPLEGVTLGDLADITRRLLACGADIGQINTVRKHLSGVKGGRFAQRCAPARVMSIVLSDVLGDSLSAIASGPAYPDTTTSEEAMAIINRYQIPLSDGMRRALEGETPKQLANVTSVITGSVRRLCEAASESCRRLGYVPHVLTTTMACEAREAGSLIASMVREIREGNSCFQPPCALILGGETVVHLRGDGLGGRNQELAAAAGLCIDGLSGVCVGSLGSDGTDGPTDAAGGIVTGDWTARCREKGLSIEAYLDENDTYSLLDATDALLVTGPTGTNVNDVAIALIR